MKLPVFGIITPLLLVAVLATSSIGAPVLPSARSGKPIQIKSNELTTDSVRKTATFTGSVVARQDDVTIFSDRLIVYYGEEESEVSKVEALGNVRVLQGNRQGQGGRATYDAKAGTIILEEKPKVSQGADTVTGNVITFFLNDDRSLVTSGADRRVEAVITPKGSGGDGRTKP